MKRFAVLSLLLSFSLCVLAHAHPPDYQKPKSEKHAVIKTAPFTHDVTIVKYAAWNDHVVIDLVTPASIFRLYDEYASDLKDEVMPVANAPPKEVTRYKFGYSKRNR